MRITPMQVAFLALVTGCAGAPQPATPVASASPKETTPGEKPGPAPSPKKETAPAKKPDPAPAPKKTPPAEEAVPVRHTYRVWITGYSCRWTEEPGGDETFIAGFAGRVERAGFERLARAVPHLWSPDLAPGELADVAGAALGGLRPVHCGPLDRKVRPTHPETVARSVELGTVDFEATGAVSFVFYESDFPASAHDYLGGCTLRRDGENVVLLPMDASEWDGEQLRFTRDMHTTCEYWVRVRWERLP